MSSRKVLLHFVDFSKWKIPPGIFVKAWAFRMQQRPKLFKTDFNGKKVWLGLKIGLTIVYAVVPADCQPSLSHQTLKYLVWCSPTGCLHFLASKINITIFSRGFPHSVFVLKMRALIAPFLCSKFRKIPYMGERKF